MLILVGFTLFLIGLIWVLQIFFIDNYFEGMKMKEVSQFGNKVEKEYIIDKRSGWNTIKDFTSTSDVDVTIEDENGVLLNPIGQSVRSTNSLALELVDMRERLQSSGLKKVNQITSDKKGHKTLITAQYLENPSEANNNKGVIMYVISPLYPGSSSVSIFRTQLVYISFIALLIALLMGVVISNIFSNPIKKINEDAQKMAKGDYSIRFEGGDLSEIQQLAYSLNKAVYELDRADKYMRDVIANVSHDLKTPLTMVKSYGELIRDISGDNPTKRNDHINIIIHEADRLNALVSDMLDLSAIKYDKESLSISKFCISDSLEGLKQQYGLYQSQRQYDFHWDIDKNLWITGDSNKIKRAMYNYINNAVKYCGDDKYIAVSLKRIKNEKIRFQVEDHGPGISEEDQNNIWKRYFKASKNHKRTATGTGLGLAIVKEICQLHGGECGVESQLGEGSIFWFELDVNRDQPVVLKKE